MVVVASNKPPSQVKDLLSGARFRLDSFRESLKIGRGGIDPTRYWSRHTVHVESFDIATRAGSLRYFDWRCSRYPGLIALMPVAGFDDQVVLDFGCGPGHDLVGLLEYSRPRAVIGYDVSPQALLLAKQRISLHDDRGIARVLTGSAEAPIDLPSSSVDYVHCSGVLHHLSAPSVALAEIERVLRPGGRARCMVYHRESVWRNFFVPYVLQVRRRAMARNLSRDAAFTRSTDGPRCPIADSYSVDQMAQLGELAGLEPRVVGISISQLGLDMWSRYSSLAVKDWRTPMDVLDFIEQVSADDGGLLVGSNGLVAGLNLVVEFCKPDDSSSA